MVRPTAADVRKLSRVDFTSRGYAEDVPDPLDDVVTEACDYIEFVTARTFVSMPAGLTSIATAATRMRTEQVVLQNQDENVEPVGDIDLISGFSAGSYNEQRRDPAPRAAGPLAGYPAVNSWPALNQRLWMMLTLAPGETNPDVLDRHDYWLATLSGLNVPAWDIVQVDWTNRLSVNTISPSEPWSRYI